MLAFLDNFECEEGKKEAFVQIFISKSWLITKTMHVTLTIMRSEETIQLEYRVPGVL